MKIVLENGNLHLIKANALFQKAISFKCFPGGFLKGPMVSEISVPNHAKNLLG
jgi:hypothetical protein